MAFPPVDPQPDDIPPPPDIVPPDGPEPDTDPFQFPPDPDVPRPDVEPDQDEVPPLSDLDHMSSTTEPEIRNGRFLPGR